MKFWLHQLGKTEKTQILFSWTVGFVLSLLMLQIGQEIRFWTDHSYALKSQPMLVATYTVPWFLLFGILSWTRVYLSTKTATNIEKSLYEKLLKSTLNLFPAPENVLNRFNIDIPEIANSLTHRMAMGVRHTFFTAASFIMMCLTSPILTGAIVAIFPVMMGPFFWQLRKLKASQKILMKEKDNLTAHVEECLTNLSTIQAFSQEGQAIKKWGLLLRSYVQANKSNGFRRAVLAWWLITSVSLGVFGVIMYGAQHVSLTTGDMVSFIFYAILFVSGLTAFSNTMRDMVAAKEGMARIEEVLQVQTIEPKTKRKFPSQAHGMLACHHVHFAYPNNPKDSVLKGVTFSLSPGELMALVGPSGAGKTTLFKLLLGFYSPQSGSIHIDGIDIKKVSTQALRERIGFVGQEPVLFSGTVYENIIYGKPHATQKEVHEAMELAGVTPFLDQWPNAEHTDVKAINLSGGQKQCVALARAIIRKPSIFLLDEPTNALDAESEALVYNAFRRVSQHHTTLMIAHRLSTVIHAHKIAVLDKGVIQAVGNHGELVNQSALYRRFVMLQFALDNIPS